jgi:hypothetical protein
MAGVLEGWRDTRRGKCDLGSPRLVRYVLVRLPSIGRRSTSLRTGEFIGMLCFSLSESETCLMAVQYNNNVAGTYRGSKLVLGTSRPELYMACFGDFGWIGEAVSL